jgi:8-oxo-dGTP pyrophosphatase MutT (NUDIX family)
MKEESFGIIPLKQGEEGYSIFLIQHKGAKHWGFPKGKSDEGETPLQSAQRELLEETALSLQKILQDEPFIEEYTFTRHGEKISKKVYYFAALVSGEPKLQENEIVDGKWVLLKNAERQLTFEQSRKTVRKLLDFFEAKE